MRRPPARRSQQRGGGKRARARRRGSRRSRTRWETRPVRSTLQWKKKKSQPRFTKPGKKKGEHGPLHLVRRGFGQKSEGAGLDHTNEYAAGGRSPWMTAPPSIHNALAVKSEPGVHWKGRADIGGAKNGYRAIRQTAGEGGAKRCAVEKKEPVAIAVYD